MAPHVYLTCVRRLLGLAVILLLLPVLFASKPWMFNHALCCKKSSDTITRHNRVRNLIFQFTDMGLLSPELEKLGILGVTDRSRRREMCRSRAGLLTVVWLLTLL